MNKKPRKKQELVTPYCRGCGHRYFNYPKVSSRKARWLLCHWCIEDEDED